MTHESTLARLVYRLETYSDADPSVIADEIDERMAELEDLREVVAGFDERDRVVRALAIAALGWGEPTVPTTELVRAVCQRVLAPLWRWEPPRPAPTMWTGTARPTPELTGTWISD